MKRKLIKRNKNKLTRLQKLASINDMYLQDLIRLFASLKEVEADRRVSRKKGYVEILLWDEARSFLGNRYAVPLAMRHIHTGKVVKKNCSRILTEDEYKNQKDA